MAWPTRIVIFGFIIYYFYATLYPFKVMEIVGTPQILGEVLKAGDDLCYEVNYKKYIPVGGTMYNELVDTVIYNLKETKSNANVGEGSKIICVGHVPKVPSGKYYLRVKAVYQVNMYRTIEIVYQTNEFEIND